MTLTPELAEVEAKLSHAIDHYADNEEAKGDRVVEAAVERLKGFLQGPERRSALMLWGMSLQLLREPEQALLRYEEILHDVPGDEGALWQCVQIFLVDMENPTTARRILEDRLLPVADKPEYRDALQMARLALGERPGKEAEEAAAAAALSTKEAGDALILAEEETEIEEIEE
jgi:predicted Zn-dependent protease